MANKFEIVISAVDKATAVMRHVEAQTNRLTEPYKKLGQSMSSFSRASGLSNVGKELGKVRDVAGDVASKVASILPPLAGLAGVASVAGIAAMATSWGSAGAEIDRTSSVIGVGTTKLQELRGATRLAGLSADDMTGGLKSLGSTLEDAVTGRNQTAAGVMRQFGISLYRTKDGAVDSARALIDVSNAMKRLGGNVQAQQKFASIFGVENLLPLLQKGGAGIDAYVRQFDKLGGVMSPAQLAQADKYNQGMIKLEMAFDRMKWTVGNALAPTLLEFVDWLGRVGWNKTTRAIGDIVDKIKSVVEALGGWKAVGEEVIAFMGIRLVGSLVMATVKIGLMAAQWKAVSAAAEEAKGAQILAAEAGSGTAAAGAGVGTAGSAVAGAGFSLLSRLAPGLFAMFHSSDDGGAEEAWATENRAAGKGGAAGGLFAKLEKQYQLPAGLLDGVYNAESSRGKNLHSKKGAIGPFQFEPATAKQYGITDPMDLVQSATGAAKMFRERLDADHGDVATALADYNWGQGHVAREGLIKAPKETRDYIGKVFQSMGFGSKPFPSLYAKGAPVTPVETGSPTGTVVSANQPGGGDTGSSAGQVDVVVEFVNAPAGMRPHIKTSGNVTARIGHSDVGLAPI